MPIVSDIKRYHVWMRFPEAQGADEAVEGDGQTPVILRAEASKPA